MESDKVPPPQLKGVVIITLPPPGNPSLGKTITAFTLSDSQPSPFRPQTHHHQQHQEQLPVGLPRNPERHFSFRRIRLLSPIVLFGFLGISLFALIMWSSVFSFTFAELRRSDDDREPNSFVYPLYSKLGIQETSKRDIELKLGSFVERDLGASLASTDYGKQPRKVNKVVSTVSSMDSSTMLPVLGNVYPNGLYYTYMLVGTPPRPYFLDMDTGSDLTWIQCDAPCTSCAKGPHPFYKPTKGKLVPSKDSLCKEVQRKKIGYCVTCEQCDYEIVYADQSSSMGVLAKDVLHLMISNGSLSKSNVVFGCGYDQQGLLLNSLSKTDGILGLSRAKVSLPSQLASQGIIKNVVGHCLTTNAGGGSYMFLGDNFVQYRGMAWVPMLNSPSINFYHSEIFRISYGRRQLSLGGPDSEVGRVVFDSGSSYTYFTKRAYSDLVASLKEVNSEELIRDPSDHTLPICWHAKFPIRSVMDVKQFFKPFTLHFGSYWWVVSTKLRITPEGYLIISSKGNVCLGILDGSNVIHGSAIIIGDISMRGQLIVYDNVNQKIGWAKSDCVKPQRFNSLPFF